MACLCTDLLDDLYLKFELIIELINTIIDLLRKGGGHDKIIAKLRQAMREDVELLEILSAILETI